MSVSRRKLLKFLLPDFTKILSEQQIAAIRAVPYIQQDDYLSSLDYGATLDFYLRRYVKQLYEFRHLDHETVVADIGSGLGWLVFTLAFCTESRIIAVETDTEKLRAAKQIAKILELEERIEWRKGQLGALPMRDAEVNVAFCLGRLEFINRDPVVLADLGRISNEIIVVQTANQCFPVSRHRLYPPLLHWLPDGLRQIGRKLLGLDAQSEPRFWTPKSLLEAFPDYDPVSNWEHYKSFEDYKDTFPIYAPYRKGRYLSGVGVFKGLYYEIVSRFGKNSHLFTPSLAFVLKRKG